MAAVVAVGVGAVGWYAHYQIAEMSERGAAAVMAVLESEQRNRWLGEVAAMAMSLEETADRGAKSPPAEGSPNALERASNQEIASWAAPLARANLGRASGLQGVLVVRHAAGSRADQGAREPAAILARGNHLEAIEPRDVIAAWRDRADPARPYAEARDGQRARLALIHPVGRWDSGHTPELFIVGSYSIANLSAAAADLQARGKRESRTSVALIALIGAAAILLAIIVILLQARGAALAASAPAALDPGTEFDGAGAAYGDEQPSSPKVGLGAMADELATLLQDTAEKSIMDKDLEVVQTVQTTLVPEEDRVVRQSFELAGKLYSAGKCGGDWWTYRDLANGRLLLAIGDVTGRGASAAMITGAAKAACDLACNLHDNRPNAAEVLDIMNQAVYYAGGQRLFMTCFVAIVELKSGQVELANAGHNFPWVYRTRGDDSTLGPLVVRGNRLGDSLDSRFEMGQTALTRGDILVMYTDGIVEGESPNGTQYGERRFRAAVRRGPHHDPLVLRDALIADVLELCGGTAVDDMTLVVARVS